MINKDSDRNYGRIGNLKIQTKQHSRYGMSHNSQYFKAAFSNSEANKILVVVILPYMYPDQVWMYAASECK